AVHRKASDDAIRAERMASLDHTCEVRRAPLRGQLIGLSCGHSFTLTLAIPLFWKSGRSMGHAGLPANSGARLRGNAAARRVHPGDTHYDPQPVVFPAEWFGRHLRESWRTGPLIRPGLASAPAQSQLEIGPRSFAIRARQASL